MTPAAPDPALVGRFAAGLDRLHPAGEKLGLAVSGGPDSLAMLVLAAAARPGLVEAATVDHALRPEARDEAEMVAHVSGALGVPHSTLTVQWKATPATGLQERARDERYRLLDGWAVERHLNAVATAHHLDDQVETLLMRLNRGAGVRGLAGMRADAQLPTPGSKIRLVRPLLEWRRSELEELCRSAELVPAQDPSNADERFERVRVRRGIAGADWVDAEGIARSADYLGRADDALEWAADLEWQTQVSVGKQSIAYRPSGPAEIRRRIVARCVERLASEGRGNLLRGRELDQLVGALTKGGKATLRGVVCSGGEQWSFAPAPERRQAD